LTFVFTVNGFLPVLRLMSVVNPLFCDRLLDHDASLHRAQDIMEMITERNRLQRDSTLYTKVSYSWMGISFY